MKSVKTTGGLIRMPKSDRRVYAVLFFSIFSTVTGVGIVVPLLPVYAHGLGASGLYIGLIFGAFSLSRTCLLPYFGRLSDRKGRKPFIVMGLLAYALISIAFIFSDSVELLIVVRFVQGIASAAIMPVTQAYVGDITPSGYEGTSMGLFNVSTFLGLGLGPMVGGALNDHFSLDTAFACMGVLAMVGFALSLRLLPPTECEVTIRRPAPSFMWRRLLRDREIAGLFVFRFVYTTAIGIIWCFLPVYADVRFHLTSFQIGTLVMLAVMVSGATNVPMGMLADRVDKRYMTVIGGLVVVSAMYSFVWVEGFAGLFVSNLFFGLGGGIAMPPVMGLVVAKGHRIKAMGALMALMTMAHSLGMLTGSLMAGGAMDIFELYQAFPVGAVFVAIGVVVFFYLSGDGGDPS